jgi:hypothetical protein
MILKQKLPTQLTTNEISEIKLLNKEADSFHLIGNVLTQYHI